MALVDAFTPPYTDEEVLVVVRHPDHFVRHHLPDGKDQVVPAFEEHAVHLHGHGIVGYAARYLADVVGRHGTDMHDTVAPVMHAKERPGDAGEHFFDLPVRHWKMRPDGGKNIRQVFAVILVDVACQFPRP